jgi:hypothetical protein
MATIQTAPLAPDVEYFLDGALDTHEIGSFCHCAVSLYGDRSVVNRIVDFEDATIGRLVKRRQATCLRLDAYAHELARELPTADQRALFAAGLLYEPKRSRDLAEVLCGWNFEDSTVGGALEPFRNRPRLTRAGSPPPRINRHLAAPSAIWRYVARCDQVDQQRELVGRLRRLPWPECPAEAEVLEPLFAEARRRYAEANARAWAALFAPDGAFSTGNVLKIKRELVRERRRLLRRSAIAATAILGATTVSAFARGEPVVLPGRELVFSLTARNLAAQGHGALDVQLCSHGGDDLGGLCLYFDGMPALDQLAAVALHVAAGNETTLLDTGNLTALTAAGAGHPAILARTGRVEPPREVRGRFRYDRARLAAASRAYQAKTLPLYLDALVSTTWRGDLGRYRRFVERIAA